GGVDSPPGAPADPEHARLWEALGHDPAGIDQLALRTGLTVDALSSMLLLMELEGRVRAAHGRYARREAGRTDRSWTCCCTCSSTSSTTTRMPSATATPCRQA